MDDIIFTHYVQVVTSYNLKGQVTRAVWMTRPHITILQIWHRVRARVDGLVLWNLQDVMSQ